MQRKENALFDMIDPSDSVVTVRPTGDGDLLVITATGRLFILLYQGSTWRVEEQVVKPDYY